MAIKYHVRFASSIRYHNYCIVTLSHSPAGVLFLQTSLLRWNTISRRYPQCLLQTPSELVHGTLSLTDAYQWPGVTSSRKDALNGSWTSYSMRSVALQEANGNREAEKAISSRSSLKQPNSPSAEAAGKGFLPQRWHEYLDNFQKDLLFASSSASTSPNVSLCTIKTQTVAILLYQHLYTPLIHTFLCTRLYPIAFICCPLVQ